MPPQQAERPPWDDDKQAPAASQEQPPWESEPPPTSGSQRLPGTPEFSGWQGAVSLGKGLGESFVQTGHGIAGLARKAIEQGGGPQLAEAVIPQARLSQLQTLATPTDPTQAIAKSVGQGLQFLAVPGGGEIGLAGAGARILGSGTLSMLQDPNVSGKAFLYGAAGGGLGEIPGLLGKYVAPAYAESRLAAPDRGVWKTGQIGQEFLEQRIPGLTPAQIERNTNIRIEQLKTQRNALVNQATQRGVIGSNANAQQILENAIRDWPPNDREGIASLESLRDALHFGPAGAVGPGGYGQRLFTPSELLLMKNGIDKQVGRWGARMQADPVADAMLKQLRASIDNEVDRIVPGSRDLNHSISRLVPMARRAAVQQSQASTAQNLLHKLAVHTGALTAGAHYGLTTPEGIAAFALPELIATPTGRMIGAKTLNLAARPIPRYVIPRATAAGITYLTQR